MTFATQSPMLRSERGEIPGGGFRFGVNMPQGGLAAAMSQAPQGVNPLAHLSQLMGPQQQQQQPQGIAQQPGFMDAMRGPNPLQSLSAMQPQPQQPQQADPLAQMNQFKASLAGMMR